MTKKYTNKNYLQEYGEAYLLYTIKESLNHNFHQSLEYSSKFLEMFPQDPEGIFNYGVSQYFNKNYDKALSYLLSINLITEDSELVKSAYYYIALISKEFNYRKAIIDFCEKALEIDAAMYEAHIELAFTYFKISNYQESKKHLERALVMITWKNPPEKDIISNKLEDILKFIDAKYFS